MNHKMKQTIYLGTDHAGFALKEAVKKVLVKKDYIIEDCGAFTFNANDDYPDFVGKAAENVSEDPLTRRGIVFGGSGQAEMMVANKFKGVRCALFYTPGAPVGAADVTGRTSTDPFEIVRLTREHNNANMLSLSSRFLTEADAITAVLMWLETPFPGDERHVRRIQKIAAIEQ
jgi:ribose 5-phosphate isomerase B